MCRIMESVIKQTLINLSLWIAAFRDMLILSAAGHWNPVVGSALRGSSRLSFRGSSCGTSLVRMGLCCTASRGWKTWRIASVCVATMAVLGSS